MYRYKNFSESGNRSINSAVDIAGKLGHISVGTEHLLLGLLSQGKTDAGDLALEYNMNFTGVYNVISNILGSGSMTNLCGDDLSQNAVAVLKNAFQAAVKGGRVQAGINDILYGITTVPKCMAYKIITSFSDDIAGFSLRAKQLCERLNDLEADRLAPQEQTRKELKTIEKYSKNLTKAAKLTPFDPCIGRENEISRLIEILLRRQKNNPCLVGLAGVGKTAIVEGTANMIAQHTAPKEMWNKTIYALDLASLLAGTKYRGDFEERIKSIIDEATGEKDIILFIDEIHIITSAGGAEGAIDAANILKPALARGKIQVIGATTQEEYARIIEKDSALERRFSKILVEEPDTKTAIDILLGIKEKYQAYHNVQIKDEAVKKAVILSQRYINARYLPDKAVDLMDEACARVRLCERSTVEEEDIEQIISRQTGIPISRLETDEQQQLMNLEYRLDSLILGQSQAVKSMTKALKRWRVGLSDETRPIASFLFLGPTGVGKTQSCKALAQCLFHSEKALIRIDCTEFGEKNDITKLIGSPPGYVGYEDGGRLEKELIEKPYSVVLFDEIEKAHPDLYNLLLQAMDNGFITSAQGRKVSFRNTVIIMTSNLGAKELGEKAVNLGFSISHEKREGLVRQKLELAVKDRFSPEFIGRIDEIITFSPLDEITLESIAKIMLGTLAVRLEKQGIKIEYDESVAKIVCSKSANSVYGARDLRSCITNLVENPVCDFLLENQNSIIKNVLLTVENEQITVKTLAEIK